jgi:hypothetical protein
MTDSALLALQQAIYTALQGSAPLNNLVNGIYDQPPADAVYPFVAIERISAENGDMAGISALQARCDLVAYSRYHGKSEYHRIVAELQDILHRASLSVAGFHVARCEVESVSVSALSDFLTTAGTVQCSIALHQSA